MLAAGVAHERIRNPLTAIKRACSPYKSVSPPARRLHRSEVIAQESMSRSYRERCPALRHGQTIAQLVTINAEEPLREVEALLSQSWKNRALISRSKEPMAVAQYRSAANQAGADNLVQTPPRDIGEDGTIRLRARRELKRLAAGKVEAVILEVIDNGKGIPRSAGAFVRSVLLDQETARVWACRSRRASWRNTAARCSIRPR